jgi:hypothetical protein
MNRDTQTPLPELDCGDNSCLFALKKGGMRTNGGCCCFDTRNQIETRHLIYRLAKERKELHAALATRPQGEAAPTKSQAKRIALQREAPIMPPTCKECGLIICKCPTSEGAASEVEERHGYEIFFDRGYYELWAVRKKGVTSLEQTLHAPTRQEAINIAFALSQAEQRAAKEAREETAEVVSCARRLVKAWDANSRTSDVLILEDELRRALSKLSTPTER